MKKQGSIEFIHLCQKFLSMNALELKVPPVAAALLIASAMWFASSAVPSSIEAALVARVIAAAILAVVGAGIGLAGVASFRNARTTVNPTRPGATSVLVGSGVYRISRNPMYLGILLILFAWATFLSHPLAFVLAAVFVPCMTRFQIAPGERILAAMFGAEFVDYRARVRRWL